MKVVINLVAFVDEVYLALAAGNEEDLKELDDKFCHFCKTRSRDSVDKSFSFIFNRKIVSENKNLKDYFEKFRM